MEFKISRIIFVFFIFIHHVTSSCIGLQNVQHTKCFVSSIIFNIFFVFFDFPLTLSNFVNYSESAYVFIVCLVCPITSLLSVGLVVILYISKLNITQLKKAWVASSEFFYYFYWLLLLFIYLYFFLFKYEEISNYCSNNKQPIPR